MRLWAGISAHITLAPPPAVLAFGRNGRSLANGPFLISLELHCLQNVTQNWCSIVGRTEYVFFCNVQCRFCTSDVPGRFWFCPEISVWFIFLVKFFSWYSSFSWENIGEPFSMPFGSFNLAFWVHSVKTNRNQNESNAPWNKDEQQMLLWREARIKAQHQRSWKTRLVQGQFVSACVALNAKLSRIYNDSWIGQFSTNGYLLSS